MELETLLASLLMPLALICAFWLCLPDILILLGRWRIERGILGGPDEVPRFADYISEDVGRELDSLGFRPLGVYWETMPGHKMFREVIFSAREGDCFAAAFRLFDNDLPRVLFFRSLADGTSVLTQNYPGGVEADEPRLRAGCPPAASAPPPAPPEAADGPAPKPSRVPTVAVWLVALLVAVASRALESLGPSFWIALGSAVVVAFVFRLVRIERVPADAQPMAVVRYPIPEVLAEHRDRLRHFARAGATPAAAAALDDFVEGQRVYAEHPRVGSVLRGASLVILPVKLSFLALGPVILACEVGPAHPATWAALLLGCLGVVLFRHYGFPLIAAADRQGAPAAKGPNE